MPPVRGRGAYQAIGRIAVVAVSWLASQTNAQIIYVNHAATGANNGRSFEDAFTSLHDGLSATSDDEWNIIYVAAGVYRPSDAGVFYTRTRAFTITNRVDIYGGFSQGPDGNGCAT